MYVCADMYSFRPLQDEHLIPLPDLLARFGTSLEQVSVPCVHWVTDVACVWERASGYFGGTLCCLWNA